VGFFRRESNIVRALYGESKRSKNAVQMSLFGGTMLPAKPPGDA